MPKTLVELKAKTICAAIGVVTAFGVLGYLAYGLTQLAR